LPFISKEPGYDGRRDFASVSLVTRYPLVMVINPKLPANNTAEFIAMVKVRSSGRAIEILNDDVDQGRVAEGTSGFDAGRAQQKCRQVCIVGMRVRRPVSRRFGGGRCRSWSSPALLRPFASWKLGLSTGASFVE
jgi:hypothetical protein